MPFSGSSIYRPDMTEDATKLRPPTPASAPRIGAVDALRGFALLGVCLANFPNFNMGSALVGVGVPSDSPEVPTSLDSAAGYAVNLLVDGRFISIFEMLFGFGIALMATRLAQAGIRTWPVLVRRLTFLAVAGLLHTLVIWTGDILFLYAVVGLAFLPVVLGSTRVLWIVGAMCFGIAVASSLAAGAVSPEGPGRAQPGLSLLPVLSTVSRTLWLFSVGALIYRHGLVRRLRVHDAPGRALLIVGLVVGLPAAIVSAPSLPLADRLHPMFGDLAFSVGAPFLAGTYIVIFMTWYSRYDSSLVAVALTSLGRLAFSAYILQSIIGGAVHTVADWTGVPLGRFALFMAALIVVVLQSATATLWLSRFSYGPLEGLWRAVTYWRRPSWT